MKWYRGAYWVWKGFGFGIYIWRFCSLPTRQKWRGPFVFKGPAHGPVLEYEFARYFISCLSLFGILIIIIFKNIFYFKIIIFYIFLKINFNTRIPKIFFISQSSNTSPPLFSFHHCKCMSCMHDFLSALN